MKKAGIAKAAMQGSSTIEAPFEPADGIRAREQRNIARVYNPHLRPGQRGCHQGFAPPIKRWTSALEQAMENYGK